MNSETHSGKMERATGSIGATKKMNERRRSKQKLKRSIAFRSTARALCISVKRQKEIDIIQRIESVKRSFLIP